MTTGNIRVGSKRQHDSYVLYLCTSDRSPGDSTDSRGAAASARDVEPPYSTTVSAALSASALLIPPGDAAGMAEVLQVGSIEGF